MTSQRSNQHVSFSGEERQEKQASHIKSTAQQLQDEINEQAKKDKKSSVSRAPAGREMCDYRIKSTKWRNAKLD